MNKVFVYIVAAILLANSASALTRVKRTVYNPLDLPFQFYLMLSCAECGDDPDNSEFVFGPYTAPPQSGFTTPYVDLPRLGVDYSVKIVWIRTTASPLGNSYVMSGADVVDYANVGVVATYMPTDPDEGDVYHLPFLRLPNPDGKKTLWTNTDGTLTGNLFREGIDKIVGFVGSSAAGGGSSGGGTAGEVRVTNGDGSTAETWSGYKGELTMMSTAQAEAIVDAYKTQDALTLIPHASASSSVKIFTLDLTAFGKGTLALTAMGLEGFGELGSDINSLISWFAPIMREILLLGAAIAFVVVARNSMERWLATALISPQLTTKAEAAQVHVPLVGHSKQIVTATAYFIGLVVAVAAGVTFGNTQLGAILPGETIQGITSGGAFQFWADIMTGYEKVAACIQLAERFIPLHGLIQFMVAEIIIVSAMPLIFAGIITLTKALHI